MAQQARAAQTLTRLASWGAPPQLLEATHEAAAEMNLPLLMGIDANVYETPGKSSRHFEDWVKAYVGLGLTSCWGDAVDPVASRTTYNARTFVQPQLQKAVRLAEFTKGDCNPKVR